MLSIIVGSLESSTVHFSLPVETRRFWIDGLIQAWNQRQEINLYTNTSYVRRVSIVVRRAISSRTKQGRLPIVVDGAKHRTYCHRIEHDRVRRVLRRRLQRVVRCIPYESQPQCSQCMCDSGLGERPRIFVSGQGARSRPRSVQYPASSRLCRLESQRGWLNAFGYTRARPYAYITYARVC
jgi:hypothetical protein